MSRKTRSSFNQVDINVICVSVTIKVVVMQGCWDPSRISAASCAAPSNFFPSRVPVASMSSPSLVRGNARSGGIVRARPQ